MRKPRGVKLRRYSSHLINLNKYLDLLPVATMYDKIGVTELDKIMFNIMPNRWSKQALDCESMSFFKAVNVFERMDIAESIYECLVEPSYKKPTMPYANHDGHSRQKRG